MSEQPKIEDGGPAFPSHGSMGEVAHEGMRLRDYFAAQAMHGLLAHRGIVCGTPQSRELAITVADSYLIADAMLQARKAGGAS